MSDLADMAERLAERDELERLRVENARLKRRVEALERDAAQCVLRRYYEALRVMTPMEQTRYASQSFGPPSSLFGAVMGARWP